MALPKFNNLSDEQLNQIKKLLQDAPSSNMQQRAELFDARRRYQENVTERIGASAGLTKLLDIESEVLWDNFDVEAGSPRADADYAQNMVAAIKQLHNTPNVPAKMYQNYGMQILQQFEMSWSNDPVLTDQQKQRLNTLKQKLETQLVQRTSLIARATSGIGKMASRLRSSAAGTLSQMDNPLGKGLGWLLQKSADRSEKRKELLSVERSLSDQVKGAIDASERSIGNRQYTAQQQIQEEGGLEETNTILEQQLNLLDNINETLGEQRQDDKDRFQEESERAERLSEAQQMELPLQDKEEKKEEEKEKSGGLFSLLAGLAGTLFSALSGGLGGFFSSLMGGIGGLLTTGFNAVFGVLKLGARLAFDGIRGLLSAGLRTAFTSLSGLISGFAGGTLSMGATALGLTAGGAAVGGAYALGALKLIGGDAFATNAEFKKAKERGIDSKHKGAIELSARNKLYDYLRSQGMDEKKSQEIANDIQSVNVTPGESGGVTAAEVDAEYVEKKIQEWRDAEANRSQKATEDRESRLAARDAEMQAKGRMVLGQTQVPADLAWGTGPESLSTEGGTTVPTTAPMQDGTNGRLRDSQLESIPGGNGRERLSNAGAADAFKRLSEHAQKSGVNLSLESAYRTYEHQEALFNEKGPGWAARPGHSKHGDGLAVDIAVGRSFTSPAYQWLAANAPNFGFTNTGKNFKKQEPWHWQYTGEPNKEIGDPVGAPTRPASTIASSSATVSRNATPIIINQNLMAPQNTMIGASAPTPIPIPIVTRSSSLAPYLAVNSV